MGISISFYGQLGAYGGAVGVGREGLTAQAYADGNAVVTGTAVKSVTYSWNGDVNTKTDVYLGGSLPPGLPVAASIQHSVTSGSTALSAGVGVGSVFEVGLIFEISVAQEQTEYAFAIGTVSSARLDGQRGLVRAGNEMNALDVIAAINHQQGGGSITPPPPGGYNFPDPLGGHGPSFSPSRPGPGPAPTPMNLSSHPLSTPKAGGFTVLSHTGYSSRDPYALEGGGATSPAASVSPPGTCTGPGLTSPSLPGATVSSTSNGASIGGLNTGGGPSSSSSGMGIGIGPNGITPSLPVVLDLNGNGVEISLSYKAAFDYNGNGFRQPTAWVAPGDGFLVIDLNADGTRGAGDGKIDQARELVLSMWGPAGSTDLQAVYKRNYGVPMAA